MYVFAVALLCREAIGVSMPSHCKSPLHVQLGTKSVSSRRVWGSYTDMLADHAATWSITVAHHPIDNAQQLSSLR